MTDVALVLSRFTMHELAIRRLYTQDADFRTVCDDYGTAVRALAVWEADHVKAADYRQLIQELEDELREYLEAATKIR